ncbi:hypothetical protein [uncultured Muribaculum sp.]|nr:hypothetical protein [uncultured Muribaculum sp.]
MTTTSKADVAINKVVVYPALILKDSLQLCLDDTCIWLHDTVVMPAHKSDFQYRPLRLRHPVSDHDSIAGIFGMLSRLEYIRDLGYSNTEEPGILEIDSLGKLSWKLFYPSLLGQILLFKDNGTEIIWMTTEGVEIDGKLYAYSEELKRYFEKIARERINRKKPEW